MQARMPGVSILSAGLGGKALHAVAGKSQAEATWEKKGKLPSWQMVAGDLPPEVRPQQGFSAPVASMAAEPDCLGKAGNTAGVLEGHGGCFPPEQEWLWDGSPLLPRWKPLDLFTHSDKLLT